MPLPESFFAPMTPIRGRHINRNCALEWLPGSGFTPTDGNIRPTASQQALRASARVILLIAVFILSARLIQLQIVRAGSYRVQAEQNRVRLERIAAPRGRILDRNGVALVDNSPNFSLVITPIDLPPPGMEFERILATAARFLALPVDTIREAITKAEKTPREASVLVDQLPNDQAIATTIAVKNLPGFSVIPRASRVYRDPEALALVVGYMSKVSDQDLSSSPGAYSRIDMVGRSGLERQYEDVLRGQPGQRRVERNSSNAYQRVIANEDPVPGTDIVLGIDEALQNTLSNDLSVAVSKLHSTGGAAIAIDPRNGEIRALVSTPSFNPNDFFRGFKPGEYEALSQNENHPFLNRVISAEYPSGSTIKPVFAAGALDAGIITSSTTVISTGGIRIGQWFFPDWKAGGHGATNVTKALAESVNTFFYTIGGGNEAFKGLGIRRLTETARSFGFGGRLGIDLPGERSGFLPSPEWKQDVKGEPWYIGDTYHFAIGQGDELVTPLQIAAMTAAVANGGILYQPHLVHAYQQGNQTSLTAPVILNQRAATAETLDIVREGMRQGVQSGSSRAMLSLPVTSAGKTGTAQIGGTTQTHAWFTAFAPYDNPELAITVIVERGGEGNAVALPIARNGFATYFQEQAIDSQ